MELCYCSCVEPDGASYQSYILAEKEQQREANLAAAATRKDNSVVTEVDKDFIENDDSDVIIVDQDIVTVKPALPWDVEITERNPADGRNHVMAGNMYAERLASQ